MHNNKRQPDSRDIHVGQAAQQLCAQFSELLASEFGMPCDVIMIVRPEECPDDQATVVGTTIASDDGDARDAIRKGLEAAYVKVISNEPHYRGSLASIEVGRGG